MGPVLAVDPGRGKCGLAVVADPDRVLEQRVVPRSSLSDAVREIAARHDLRAVVLGDSTGSREAHDEIHAVVACPIVTVGEYGTTLRAEKRYFQDHPPRGLRKLIPIGLQSPPRPVDDYAAVLMGEAYWAAHA